MARACSTTWPPSKASGMATRRQRAALKLATLITSGSAALPLTASMPRTLTPLTTSSLSSMTKRGVILRSSTALIKLPTRPWPISTTWPVRLVGRTGSRVGISSFTCAATPSARARSRLAR